MQCVARGSSATADPCYAYYFIIIIIIRTFVTRAVSADILNLRRRQSLGAKYCDERVCISMTKLHEIFSLHVPEAVARYYHIRRREREGERDRERREFVNL